MATHKKRFLQNLSYQYVNLIGCQFRGKDASVIFMVFPNNFLEVKNKNNNNRKKNETVLSDNHLAEEITLDIGIKI